MDAASAPTSPADTERRRGLPPVPPDINGQLTELQRLAMNRIGGFGWHLAFIRRPAGERPTVVMRSPDRLTHAVLTEDGDLDHAADLSVRASTGI